MRKYDSVSTPHSNKFWMVIVVTSITLLATACGSSAATQSAAVPNSYSNPTSPPSPTSADSSSGNADACMLLTLDDVSKAVGVAVDNATPSGMGGVCNYTTANLRIDLTVSHTGGTKYLLDSRAKLGSEAVDVPGLGDEALFNPFPSMLMVRKGDAVYLFSYSDSSQQLTKDDVLAKEKALAEQLLSRLP